MKDCLFRLRINLRYRELEGKGKKGIKGKPGIFTISVVDRYPELSGSGL